MPKGATAILTADAYVWGPFPIPGHSGTLTAAFLNRDLGAGPIVAALKMAPESRIPAHVHHRTSEAVLVTEGSFINAGDHFGPGAFFTVAPGQVHGPHETETGCTILFLQAVEVDPTDFEIAE